jgi:hypothetical protein
VAFEKGRMRFDGDLSMMSKKAVAVDVEVRMSLGESNLIGSRA